MSTKGKLVRHGYSFEEFPEAFDMYTLIDRANSSGSEITFSLSLYGRLAIELFACEKLLLPKTKTRIKLIRARPHFIFFFTIQMLF